MPVGHVALGWVQDLRLERRVRVGDRTQVVGGWDDRSASALIDDMALGARTTRHRRTWIMGRSGYQAGDVWGRVGFMSGDEMEIWDEAAQDFREVESPVGASAPFVANGATGRLSFQFRPGVIERSAYCAAVEAIVNKPYVDDEQSPRWRVWPDIGAMPWTEWVEAAGRIRRLSFRIELPNPNWVGREDLGALVTETNATVMKMVLETDDPNGLDIDEPFVRQAIKHTVERGYGAARAEAFDPTTPKYDSKRRAPAAEVTVQLQPGRRDVGPETLRDIAEQHVRRRQPAPPPKRGTPVDDSAATPTE